MTLPPVDIRTPDQRLRVFVSSTLKELAPERKAARTAIERLRLAPVMFELGARPHPPRELYRAYLQQSDIFVGIYGERYGWVAPGETVSGLEDEYNLATGLPKLMYIRESETAREPRLVELLDRLRDDDRTSFKYYSSVQELRRLVESDLAILLAERFDQSRPKSSGAAADHPPTAPIPVPVPATLPTPLTDLIGRESELTALHALLSEKQVRLVTLLGPGGIGKSRLALACGERIAAASATAVAFADLTAIQDPDLVPNVIAQSIGVQDTGDEPILQKLTTALWRRDLLLIIDNFEHVMSAAPQLTALLSAAPGVKFLVTSRTLLRLSGEHAVEVGPLALPDGSRSSKDSPLRSDAVNLFLARARAVKPDLEATPAILEAITSICIALDGVPLAIELAAARIRLLTPAAMLARLDRALPLLAGGPRDLPVRQQTLRSTIEWSTQLLGPEEKELLSLLGVFAGGFSLEAVEHLLGDAPLDALSGLGTLVDNSLVFERDRDGRTHFSMLATVREYALEQLRASGRLDAARARHADYFLLVSERIEAVLEGGGQRDAVGMLDDDRDNLRAVARQLIEAEEWTTLTDLSWRLLIYWWVGGLLGEVRGWMAEVLASPGPLPDRTRAVALFFTNSIALWQHREGAGATTELEECAALFHRVGDYSGEALTRIALALAVLGDTGSPRALAQEALETSLRLFRESEDPWGEAMALVTLGRVALLGQDPRSAVERFEESLTLARRYRDDLGTAIALNHLGWARLVDGDREGARGPFEESLQISARLGHAEGVGQGLEGLIGIAATEHRVERAGRLLRARNVLMREAGIRATTSFSFYEHYLAPILQRVDGSGLEEAMADGPELSLTETVDYALHTNSPGNRAGQPARQRSLGSVGRR